MLGVHLHPEGQSFDLGVRMGGGHIGLQRQTIYNISPISEKNRI